MTQLEDSIVLILSSDVKNTAFGTGFIIARDQNYSYLLTCAHVLEQINGKSSTENKLQISGVNVPIEIVKCGASDDIDIALLKVAGLFDKPLFEQFMLGQEKADIKVTGYSLFDPKNGQRVQRELKGKLSKRVKIASNNQEYPFLDISIQDDDFSKLEGGYSGSPLYNSVGQVLGIVSHKRNGEMGHAFCISNLALLYPEIDTLLPNFKRQIENFRLSQIRTQLLGRMAEIAKIYLKLGKRLNQIEKEGIDDEAEIILQMCESFLNKDINAAVFSDFCQSLETAAIPTDTDQPNYKLLAQRLKNAEICLCLGAELPKLFDARLKSVQELSERIAALTGFANVNSHALAEICEYAELYTGCTRRSVVSELKELVIPPPDYQPNIELFELLVKLEKPFLVIVTGFDTLLEQRLSNSKKRFVSIVTNVAAEAENQRYLLKVFNAQQGDKLIPPSCSDEELSALQLMEQSYALIFHPRGYHDVSETLLLSERDYFFNASDLLKKRYPAYLHNKLKNTGLWFLGYQPDSWETRLLAKVLQYQRGNNNRDLPLVVEPNVDSFAQLFWREMQCTHYPNLSVTDFVAKIGASI
ncbi:MAG: trypsin-like peptidase domain-containing protein [Methylococcaceae bacterium]|nr:trypsin-like peptidase domain-containing protein [Methylococcaceae bacterium]